MDGIKWIKICSDIFDDEKMVLIESMQDGDGIIVCWFKLLCLAGKQNNSGVFMFNKIAYTDEMLATIFRRPVQLIKKALETFVSFGMVDIVDNVYTIPKWEKHQSIDTLERQRENTRQRVAAFRERQKAAVNCNSNRNVTVTSNVTACNALDKDIDIKEKEYINIFQKESVTSNTNEQAFDEETSTNTTPLIANKKKFIPPTLDDVVSYARQRGREDIAISFFDFFSVGDWVDSNGTPVKNWKQKFITWEQRNTQRQERKPLYAPPKVY